MDVVSELTTTKLSSSATHGKQMLLDSVETNGWAYLGMTGSLHIESTTYQSHKHDALILFN